MLKSCKKHGLTDFVLENNGYERCKKCRSQYVIDCKRRTKERLIVEFGGKCKVCNYKKCKRALHFHHPDPTIKEFGISDNDTTRSYATLKKEAEKCILVCSNCHAEIEEGLIDCPLVKRYDATL